MAVSIDEYERALGALSEALEYHAQSSEVVVQKLARDATIQRFEFCIELAWKTSARLMGSTSTTARPVIREMAQNKLIDDPEKWFSFIEARNKTSHSYNESVANEVFGAAREFLLHGQKLLNRLRAS
jgi:nucleotidyltransferase substrate binding protein (TIGR01987 family)